MVIFIFFKDFFLNFRNNLNVIIQMSNEQERVIFSIKMIGPNFVSILSGRYDEFPFQF